MRSETSTHFALGLIAVGSGLTAYHLIPALRQGRTPLAPPGAEERMRVDEAILNVLIAFGLIGAGVHWGSRALFAALEGRPIPEVPE